MFCVDGMPHWCVLADAGYRWSGATGAGLDPEAERMRQPELVTIPEELRPDDDARVVALYRFSATAAQRQRPGCSGTPKGCARPETITDDAR